MQIAPRHPFVAAALVALSCAGLAAQTQTQAPPRDKTQAAAASGASAEHQAIAAGWAALAQGRMDEAVRAADRRLAQNAGDHHAAGLKIEALSTSQPVRGLDAYEAWLSKARFEDVFMLVPIARGTLREIAAGPDPAMQSLALQRLARAGDAQAAAQLKATSAAARGSDVQLALEGDEAAAARLTQPKAAAAVPPQTLARALTPAGPAAAPMLRALLKHPAAPVRMEAVLALAKIGATDAIPELKPLMGDPELRSYAAVALMRLGDRDGEPVVQELLQSPVFDMRILGAQAYDGRENGPWVQALMPALQDPNGLTRLRAAELLAPVAPESAAPVLLEASKDPNPVVRADALRIIERNETALLGPQLAEPSVTGRKPEQTLDLATLRRLLRETDPTIRVHAAGTLLGLVRTDR